MPDANGNLTPEEQAALAKYGPIFQSMATQRPGLGGGASDLAGADPNPQRAPISPDTLKQYLPTIVALTGPVGAAGAGAFKLMQNLGGQEQVAAAPPKAGGGILGWMADVGRPGKPGLISNLTKPPAPGAEGADVGRDPDALGAPDPTDHSLAQSDRDIKAEAAGREKTEQLKGASPEQLLATLQALNGPRVVGMTKGGYQPSARGMQTSTEEKVQSPDWYSTLRDFEARGKSAAEGQAIVAGEQARAQADAAAQKSAQLQTQAMAEEKALAQEESARQAAQFRIDRAMADYQASGPRFQNYGTLFDQSTPAQKISGLGGMLLGLFGQAMTGQPSAFQVQLDKLIERRAQEAEADSRRKLQGVGMAENAYARLERSFSDQRAARSALRAIYAEQAKAELEQSAASIGVALENPMLQQALADLDAKKLGFLKETAAVVNETAREEEKYAPPRAVLAQGMSGSLASLIGKDRAEEVDKYESELEKRGVHQAEQGFSLMKQGLAAMKNEGAGRGKGFLLKLATSKPEAYGELVAQFGSTPGMQMFLEGFSRLRQTDVGKATTSTELINSANALGTGDPKALDTALYSFNHRIQNQKDALQVRFPGAARDYALLQEYYARLGRGPADYQGVPHPEPQTEPVPIR